MVVFAFLFLLSNQQGEVFSQKGRKGGLVKERGLGLVVSEDALHVTTSRREGWVGLSKEESLD